MTRFSSYIKHNNTSWLRDTHTSDNNQRDCLGDEHTLILQKANTEYTIWNFAAPLAHGKWVIVMMATESYVQAHSATLSLTLFDNLSPQ